MNASARHTDLSYLRSLTGNQTDKIAKYIRMFLTGAPISISQLELYTLSKDWNGVKETAHSLKPQVGYFGAKHTEQLLKEVETIAGEQRELDMLPGHLNVLREQIDQISSELEDALKELGI